MLTLKLLTGLICLFYPSRVEGVDTAKVSSEGEGSETPLNKNIIKNMVHADQIV